MTPWINYYSLGWSSFSVCWHWIDERASTYTFFIYTVTSLVEVTSISHLVWLNTSPSWALVLLPPTQLPECHLKVINLIMSVLVSFSSLCQNIWGKLLRRRHGCLPHGFGNLKAKGWHGSGPVRVFSTTLHSEWPLTEPGVCMGAGIKSQTRKPENLQGQTHVYSNTVTNSQELTEVIEEIPLSFLRPLTEKLLRRSSERTIPSQHCHTATKLPKQKTLHGTFITQTIAMPPTIESLRGFSCYFRNS